MAKTDTDFDLIRESDRFRALVEEGDRAWTAIQELKDRIKINAFDLIRQSDPDGICQIHPQQIGSAHWYH